MHSLETIVAMNKEGKGGDVDEQTAMQIEEFLARKVFDEAVFESGEHLGMWSVIYNDITLHSFDKEFLFRCMFFKRWLEELV